jgi:Epoxide hydrolase N terminus
MATIENATEIRPFRVEVPQQEIDELRRRMGARRWPEGETVADGSQGGGAMVPAAVSVFPRELYQAPRSWTEQAYPNLIYFNEVNKSNHFAAWQEPELFVSEVRAAFKPLRTNGGSS